MIDSLMQAGASGIMKVGLSDLLDMIPSSSPTSSLSTLPSQIVQNHSNHQNHRIGSVSRATKETSISVVVNLDGTGVSDVSTGIGFLDHMICQLSKHGRFDIKLHCKGMYFYYYSSYIDIVIIYY